MVQENVRHMMAEGTFYTLTDRHGRLITEVGPGERIFKTVNNWDANQMGWNVGCAMAFLGNLYDTMLERWGFDAQAAQPYLDAALALVDFEDTMPVYTYYYPSKCKIVWGAGVLLRVLLKHSLGSEALFDKLYRVAKRVFVLTFLGSQRPDGSWPALHYPLTDDAPELQFDYRVLKGLALPPIDRIAESTTSSFLPAVEITGEFLGEIGAMIEGLELLLRHYRNQV
jgi:hypothetical protein